MSEEVRRTVGVTRDCSTRARSLIWLQVGRSRCSSCQARDASSPWSRSLMRARSRDDRLHGEPIVVDGPQYGRAAPDQPGQQANHANRPLRKPAKSALKSRWFSLSRCGRRDAIGG